MIDRPDAEPNRSGGAPFEWVPGERLDGAVRMLLDQAAHAYRSLDRSITVGITAEVAVRRLGERPSIAWHARHLADAVRMVQEATVDAAEDEPELPPIAVDEWTALRSRVITRTAGALVAFWSLAPKDWLEAPLVEVHPAFRDRMTTRLSFLQGHIYHLGYHLGAIGLLRAEWGANGAD